jgi:hypothetical protein
MRHLGTVGAALALSLITAAGHAQSLADRVAAASEPRVQFTFAARPDVCGNGRSFIQVAGDQWYGSWTEGERRDSCGAGPVRVVLDRAGRDIVSISTFAGPPQPAAAGARDLGRVRASDAADYFLSLAERADGRVSRDAVLPAMLADSTDVGPRLLAIARNRSASRETRRTAIAWLGRPFDTRERAVSSIADVLVQIAKDDDDNQSVRQQALRTLGRLEHGAGTSQLMDLARDARRGWLAREALGALNASGDPRAREYLRDVVRRADQSDDVLAAAVRGVGGEYATGEDVKLIRDSYAKLPGDHSRDAALSAIATFGGADNVRWLLSLARDADQTMQTRRRAIRQAYRAGASLADVIKIYDESTDPQLKEEVLSVLVESGEKQATDKLMQIARSDENLSIRRKAVSVLSRSSDERVKKFLSDLVER